MKSLQCPFLFLLCLNFHPFYDIVVIFLKLLKLFFDEANFIPAAQVYVTFTARVRTKLWQFDFQSNQSKKRRFNKCYYRFYVIQYWKKDCIVF